MLSCSINKKFASVLSRLSHLSAFVENVKVLETRKDARSKLECATMCYSDWRCMTAVYRKNGDCLFIRNFTNTLAMEDDFQSYDITEKILEMKTNMHNGSLGSKVCVILIKF